MLYSGHVHTRTPISPPLAHSTCADRRRPDITIDVETTRPQNFIAIFACIRSHRNIERVHVRGAYGGAPGKRERRPCVRERLVTAQVILPPGRTRRFIFYQIQIDFYGVPDRGV